MKQNIIYSNKEQFLKKLEKIKKDGRQKLHILADFDRTLTNCFINGESRPSLIGAMREGNYLGNKYSKKAFELFNYYHPIEIDPDVEIEEKIKKMNQWWGKHLDLLIESGLNKKNIDEVVNSGIIKLREGTNIFFKYLDDNKVPLVIISANGLGGDSIKLFLEKQGVFLKSTNIISNDFVWNEKDIAIGYKVPIIHSFNKSETILKENKEVYKKIENRKNVILIGDSLGDHHMVDGFDYDNLINIGFLNHNEEELLSEYKKRYDIVITGDGDFSIINEILKSIK